jgi:hypothetical protein
MAGWKQNSQTDSKKKVVKWGIIGLLILAIFALGIPTRIRNWMLAPFAGGQRNVTMGAHNLKPLSSTIAQATNTLSTPTARTWVRMSR